MIDPTLWVFDADPYFLLRAVVCGGAFCTIPRRLVTRLHLCTALALISNALRATAFDTTITAWIYIALHVRVQPLWLNRLSTNLLTSRIESCHQFIRQPFAELREIDVG